MIRIVEVGPRDGLQNEAALIPTAVKIAYIDALSASGLGEIEASAFVSPRWVPQLADAEAVFAGITRRPGIVYSALVPNERGLDRALSTQVDRIALFTAATETFNRKNINATIDESIARFVPVMRRALDARLPARGYVSTAFWCPYEGKTDPEHTIEVIDRLFDLGVEEVSIGDTIGKATPEEVTALLDLILPRVPAESLAMHFHDTFGHAVPNMLAALARGITIFDSSTGGIGGCPYAPGASGNISTEKLIAALDTAGHAVPVNRAALARAREIIIPALGHPPL